MLNNSEYDNKIVITENAAFQLSYLSQQKEGNENLFISSIDLDQCEELLKSKEGLTEEDDLIILKTDIKSDDYKITYIQYDIFNPYTKVKLNLDVCQNVSIYIYSPSSLSSEAKSLYTRLNSSGYNLFNLDDSFYSDLCSTYTSEKGTDIPMNNRRNEIYEISKKYSLCQNKCTFLYLNSSNNKAKCECSAQTEDTITDKNKINFKYEIVNNFYSILKNSNFLILKCYKLVFSLEGQINNIGSYIMITINFMFIILIFLYLIFERKKIHIFIQLILQKRNILNKDNRNKNKNKTLISLPNRELKKSNSNIINKKNKFQKVGNNPPIRQQLFKNKNKRKTNKINSVNRSSSLHPNHSCKLNDNNSSMQMIKINTIRTNKFSSEKKFSKIKKLVKIQIVNKNNYKYFINNSKNKTINDKKNIVNNKKNINNNVDIFKKPFFYSSKGLVKPNKKQKIKIETEDNKHKKNKFLDLNDYELNKLKYKKALALDKRTYFQYYYSLLKQKNLFLFAFFPSNDYNLKIIKISLFLITFL